MPRKPKKKSDTKKPKGKRGRKSKASESTLTNMKIVNNKKLNINNDVELPSDKKRELIQLGYEATIQHIKQYNLTNDNLLSKPTEPSKPDEDTVPTEED